MKDKNKEYKKQVRRWTSLRLVYGENIAIFVIAVFVFLFSLVAILESITKDTAHFPNLEGAIGILGVVISIIIFKRWKRKTDNDKYTNSESDE